MHCILKWVKAQARELCPMCRQDWVISEAKAS